MNSKVYKWCGVPQCENTSIKTPHKLFVYVPHNKTTRNKWLKLARRDSKAILPSTHLYFCEDHFDLPNDMVNYMEYHLMGSVSQVRMKPGCVPTKFQCQISKQVELEEMSCTSSAPAAKKPKKDKVVNIIKVILDTEPIPVTHLADRLTFDGESIDKEVKQERLQQSDEETVSAPPSPIGNTIKEELEEPDGESLITPSTSNDMEIKNECPQSDEDPFLDIGETKIKEEIEDPVVEEMLSIDDFIQNNSELAMEYDNVQLNDPSLLSFACKTMKKRHITVSSTDSYDCTRCQTAFKSMDSYAEHVKNLTCPCCSVPFGRARQLASHINQQVKLCLVPYRSINTQDFSANQDVAITCRMCHLVLPKKAQHSELFQHWEGHLDDPNVATLAKEKTQVNYETLNAEETILNDNAREYALAALSNEDRTVDSKHCGICGRVFQRRQELKRHIIEHLLNHAWRQQLTNDGRMKCLVCEYETTSRQQFRMHMRIHTSLPRYFCEICNKSFGDSSNFAKHKKVHGMRVMECDACGRRFRCKKQIELHMKNIHNNRQPLRCELCDRTFYYMTDYRKHARTHRRPEDALAHKCAGCKESFATWRQCKDHEWAVHRIRKLKIDCSQCGARFRKRQDLKTHVRVRHGLRLLVKKEEV